MKVITLKQPWATLVAEGLKKYEFRSWKYNYRGDILIHAGVGVDADAMNRVKCLNLKFPSKRIVAKVTITDCIELTDKISEKINKEDPVIYGNSVRKGYAWKLDNVKKINIDKDISGKQGIWNYEL